MHTPSHIATQTYVYTYTHQRESRKTTQIFRLTRQHHQCKFAVSFSKIILGKYTLNPLNYEICVSKYLISIFFYEIRELRYEAEIISELI